VARGLRAVAGGGRDEWRVASDEGAKPKAESGELRVESRRESDEWRVSSVESRRKKVRVEG